MTSRRSATPPPDASIAQVLERHFAVATADTAAPASPDAEAGRLLRMVGLDDRDPGLPEQIILGVLQEARLAGLDGGALYELAQAYARGLGRISAAEAEIVRRRLRREPPETRAAALDEFLSRMAPLASLLLLAIHRARLWRDLEDALDGPALAEPPAAERTIALVDLVSSTSFLANASPAETERMVDAIYDAGLECVADRDVAPVKFAGDGLFLLGRDPAEVAAAALDAVDALERTLPLHARGGLARGPVVRRAGDYFGLVVNMTERLSKAAAWGSVLAERDSVPELPESMVGEHATKQLRGLPHELPCVALRWRDRQGPG